MELNGKDDYVARWLHAICAVPLLLFVLYEILLFLSGSVFGIMLLIRYGLVFFAVRYSYRLLKYAITGENSINKDFERPFF